MSADIRGSAQRHINNNIIDRRRSKLLSFNRFKIKPEKERCLV